MKGRIRDVDRGYKKLMSSLDAQRVPLALTVGVHEEDGGGTYEGGMTVAEVAEAHEYGLGVPARPWLSGWVDENEAQILDQIQTVEEAALKSGASRATRLDALAQRLAGDVQGRISGGIPPELAPATIARKGSSVPLIDKGQFRSNIRGKVGPA